MPKQYGTVYTKSFTATNDNAFQVDDETENVLISTNIHCYTNDCYYGSQAFQQGIIRANAVAWFDGVIRVSDLWFKNYTPGSNCTIVIAGILVKE